jgi:hypothetical protein
VFAFLFILGVEFSRLRLIYELFVELRNKAKELEKKPEHEKDLSTEKIVKTSLQTLKVLLKSEGIKIKNKEQGSETKLS